MAVVQPRLAATVMLVRDSASGLEVFMVRRSVQSEFMPDVYVFPGGSVSADDQQAEQTPDLCMPFIPNLIGDPEQETALGSGIRAAAIRELFEEANILLAYQDQRLLAISEETNAHFAAYRAAFNARQGSLVAMAQAERLTLATDHLSYFAHWITPEGLPKRYDTFFFLATAPTGQEAIYDQFETSDGTWIQPASALERSADKSFPVAFPTYHQLRDLAHYENVATLMAAAASHPVKTNMPHLRIIDGAPHVYLPDEPENAWNMQGN
jgi:8-oxo-dGTP pyrophosphatase MutT (NUDIX family)